MKMYLKKYRELADISQRELSELTSIPLGTIEDWEQTGRSPRNMQRLIPIADVLGCTTDDLLGRTIPDGAIKAISDGAAWVDVPLLGKISAGTPIEKIEIEDYFPIPAPLFDQYPNCFLLEVVGESMNRQLPNGCYALIDPNQKDIQNKQPYAVCVNGYDATIKRIKKLNNGCILIPDSNDPTYQEITYDHNNPETEEISVIGRVIWHTIPFNWEY